MLCWWICCVVIVEKIIQRFPFTDIFDALSSRASLLNLSKVVEWKVPNNTATKGSNQ